ncbi:MAG: sugar phosphate isomerase/epimerase [Actinomycetota bacterium]
MGFTNRLATAPISLGICEVPGWGKQLPVDRVLSEMRDLGFPATELGSEGYLPDDADELVRLLKGYELDMLAAFVPAVIHDPDQVDETIRRVTATMELLRATGATYVNTAPVMSWDWGPRRPLSDDEWRHSIDMLERIEAIAVDHGLIQAIHEHVGTVIEKADEIQRVVDHSSIRFVLDTAHFAIGGYDPLEFAQRYGDRVGLVHLKDCNLSIARRLNDGELSLMEAVQQGMFPCIGDGDLPIGDVIRTLEEQGYDGWYVLEQDAAITGDEPAEGAGPVLDVATSLNYLRALEERMATAP